MTTSSASMFQEVYRKPHGKLSLVRETKHLWEKRPITPILKKYNPPTKSITNNTWSRTNTLTPTTTTLIHPATKTQSQPKKEVCKYFLLGKCIKGKDCPFIHDDSKVPVCSFFLQGKCNKKDCHYRHDLTAAKATACKKFLKGLCIDNECPFEHINHKRKREQDNKFVHLDLNSDFNDFNDTFEDEQIEQATKKTKLNDSSIVPDFLLSKKE
ncbi:hypothetical protein AKO1_013420 [Acrasis kona]|uniref:C3H1-type domain-containing protein n=1 Tax=Acrasis kona TaxID=1008807 RepID=A0AAW2ZIN1_9EUKA